MVGHSPISLLTHCLHRWFAFLKSIAEVLFCLMPDVCKASWPARWWQRICCRSVKQKQPFGNICDLKPTQIENLIMLMRRKKGWSPRWEAGGEQPVALRSSSTISLFTDYRLYETAPWRTLKWLTVKQRHSHTLKFWRYSIYRLARQI